MVLYNENIKILNHQIFVEILPIKISHKSLIRVNGSQMNYQESPNFCERIYFVRCSKTIKSKYEKS